MIFFSCNTLVKFWYRGYAVFVKQVVKHFLPSLFSAESMYKIILLDLRGWGWEWEGHWQVRACLMLDGLEGLIVWYDKGKPGCEPWWVWFWKVFREGWIISRGLTIWAIWWLSTQQSIGSGNQGNTEGSLLGHLLSWAGGEHEVLRSSLLLCRAVLWSTGEGEVLGHREPGGLGGQTLLFSTFPVSNILPGKLI